MSVSSEVAAPQARSLDAGPITVIVLMCMCWGLNMVAIKFSLPDFPPLVQVAIRISGGFFIVLAWCWYRGIKLLERDGTLIPGLITGVLFGLEFAVIFPAMQFTTATRASLFIYTAPFFVALGARWFLPNEKLVPLQWFGLILCFLGLAAAIGIPQPGVDAQVLLGDIMVIAGGAAWGATTLVMKASKLVTVAPEKTLMYQLVVAIPILFALSAALGEHITHTPGPVAVWWLVFQILVVGLTFPVWFTLIQRFSATRVSAFTVLTPLFGVAAGCLLLNEPFTLAFAIAVVLVAGGLVLVNRRPRA